MDTLGYESAKKQDLLRGRKRVLLPFHPPHSTHLSIFCILPYALLHHLTSPAYDLTDRKKQQHWIINVIS